MNLQPSLKEKVFANLRKVSKPARYVGKELNMIRKEPETQHISVCLAFPDIYDIGQSYIGFHILYHILNKRRGTLCERVFAPWSDMEDIMRSNRIPLWSLENFLPVSSFDVVGFTLQYELHYTTVLNMLDLADIPLLASERSNNDPLIFGGGTCCTNPEPMAEFFDAFLLGDGEEAFPEMLDVIERCKRSSASREDTLLELAGVEGVYVPRLYRPRFNREGSFDGVEPLCEKAVFPVQSRFVTTLKPEYYPDQPLVPMCEVVHDRLSVEIMRGCSRGCRFCSAGMSYRPKRIRPIGDVVNQVVKGILATGWEELSLMSLSTSDYPGIEEIVTRIGEELRDKVVSISLSSLRADNFSLKMVESSAGGRKTGLTFAVEAGTQRLREVINKNLTEDQLIETIKTALVHGWISFKLYFMIGLPTETEDDVVAIAHLLNRLGTILKHHKGRHINVTISPFSPKPVTPFQWEDQNSLEEFREKMKLIKHNLRSRHVHIKENDPLLSLLECRLSRGGREMGAVILDAYRRGSRLDGWSECFNGGIWSTSFRNAGIMLENGGGGSVPDSPLSWGHLHFGVNESYLNVEREKALQGMSTSDCGEECHKCGPYVSFCHALKKAPVASLQTSQRSHTTPPEAVYGRIKRHVLSMKAISFLPGTRVRIKYGKNGAGTFTNHLSIIRIFDRTMRRAAIPVAYSQGFHPHPKISFGHPLPVGFKSIAEYADISLSTPFPDIETALQKGFPDGFILLGIRSIPEKVESLVNVVLLVEYFVSCDVHESLIFTIKDILTRKSIPFKRTTKKGENAVDLRPGIVDITVADDNCGFTMLLSIDIQRFVKPLEVLDLLFPHDIPYEVTRTEQYAVSQSGKVSPFEVIW
ncbi:MAG TPA: TIGR03960 family B12-binding radical SAM protein [Anaerolineae bacterium]|nr:TIGR03960 family B12-binding radical SAM protein [Anaerolineae bacterium]